MTETRRAFTLTIPPSGIRIDPPSGRKLAAARPAQTHVKEVPTMQQDADKILGDEILAIRERLKNCGEPFDIDKVIKILKAENPGLIREYAKALE